jgi:hypothetical protein
MMQRNATEHPRGERSVPIGTVWGPACNYPEGSNTCLTITYQGNAVYDVHVGIDVYMSHQDAQDILNAPGEPFVAEIMGDDGHGPLNDQVLFEVPIATGWPAAGEGSLSAEFDKRVGQRALNEDDGRDEVYARVRLFDARTGQTRIFTSGKITGDYVPGH